MCRSSADCMGRWLISPSQVLDRYSSGSLPLGFSGVGAVRVCRAWADIRATSWVDIPDDGIGLYGCKWESVGETLPLCACARLEPGVGACTGCAACAGCAGAGGAAPP